LLVRSGIAKEGNLGGRLAAGLVGKENFDLILEARKDPKSFEKSTVRNALALFDRIQNAAAGADFTKREAVSDAVYSNISVNTPLSKLTYSGTANGGKILEVAAAITEELANQQAHRQEVIDKVAGGEPTDKIQKAYPNELSQAYRWISEERVATGEAPLAQWDTEDMTFLFTAGRAGQAGRRVLEIVDEFNRSAALIRDGAPAGQDASERVEAFRAQYLEVLQGEFERSDVEDGQRLRADGQASAPVKEDGAASKIRFAGHETGTASGQPAEEVRTYSKWDGIADAPSTPSERAAFPGRDLEALGTIALRAQDTLDTIQELHQDALEANNFAQLDDFANDLKAISQSSARETDPSQKAQAAQLALTLLGELSAPRQRDPEDLATRPAICDSHKGMRDCLMALQSHPRRDPEVVKDIRALEAGIRSAAEADLARTKDIAANPQNFPAFFEAYNDAYAMEVAGPGPVSEHGDVPLVETHVTKSGSELDSTNAALADLDSVRSDAGEVLKVLDRIVARS
ncbi:MAG: hypothetical protein OXU70_16505, partial [Gammaproteobacteria bacterium]|nr:hypothetical protein [Gammaproteobacteria bacterium]